MHLVFMLGIGIGANAVEKVQVITNAGYLISTSPDQTLYFSNLSGLGSNLTHLDPRNGQILYSTNVNLEVRAMVAGPDGSLYVAGPTGTNFVPTPGVPTSRAWR